MSLGAMSAHATPYLKCVTKNDSSIACECVYTKLMYKCITGMKQSRVPCP